MPLTLQWDQHNPGVLYLNFRAQWSWEDAYCAFDQLSAMISSKPHVVDVIADLSQSTSLPTGIFWHLGNLAERWVENAGLVIFVTSNRVHTTLYVSGCGVFSSASSTIRLAETVEMARRMIEAERNLHKED